MTTLDTARPSFDTSLSDPSSTEMRDRWRTMVGLVCPTLSSSRPPEGLFDLPDADATHGRVAGPSRTKI